MKLAVIALSLLFALPQQLYAAAAFVQGKIAGSDQASGAVQAVTFDSAPTAGNLVVVMCGSSSGGTISSLVDNRGNTYSEAIMRHEDGGDSYAHMWYAENVATGTPFTVTVTFAASVWKNCIIHEYSGVATSSALDGANSSFGSGAAATSESVSPSGNSAYVGFVHATNAATTITPDAFTSRFEDESFNFAPINSADTIGSGAKTATWTFDDTRFWIALIAAFNESGGAPPPTTNLLSRRRNQ